jgi:hypothetical protein
VAQEKREEGKERRPGEPLACSDGENLAAAGGHRCALRKGRKEYS